MNSFAKLGTLTRYTCKGCYRGCAVGSPAEYVVSEVEGELGRRLGLRPEENMQEHTFGKLSQFTFFVLAKCCELHVLRSCRCRRAILIAGGEGISQWDRKRNLAMRTGRSKALQWGLNADPFQSFCGLIIRILVKIPQGL